MRIQARKGKDEMTLKEFTKNNIKRLVLTALAAVIMFTSFAAVKPMTSPENHSETIAALDEKKVTVMELAAASTAASAAITLIPGDTATPIADKLADMGSLFLIVLCAIYLEKYLVTVTGYASFMLLIPVACLLFMVFLWLRPGVVKGIMAQWSLKLAVLALALSMVIPSSMFVAEKIEATYADSINTTIQSAKEATEVIEEATETKNSSMGILAGLQQKMNSATQYLEQATSRFMEAFAVMMVTSCVIPVVVLLFFVWIMKILVGVNIPLPGRLTAFYPVKDSMRKENYPV